MPALTHITAFTAGFVLMGFEMFGTRVLAPFFGSGMPVWGATISVVMAGLSFGYAAGGVLADKHPSIFSLAILLAMPALLLAAFPLYGKAVCSIVDHLDLGRRLSSLAAASLLFPVPAFFIGATSPLLVKLKVLSVEKVGRGSGGIYAAGTAGSIAGTLLSAFLLVGVIPSPLAISIFGCALLANALAVIPFAKLRR